MFFSKKLISNLLPYPIDEIVFESNIAGEYSVNIIGGGKYEITCVGGGGPAALRGVYDDRGYGWGGGSGSAFKGIFYLTSGTYNLVVASANNNTIRQTSNSQTSNPPDETTHDSYINGVLLCPGGGFGHYAPSHVGAGGTIPELTLEPISIELNTNGNDGKYNSGGKGSAPSALCAGGISVFENHGTGQGCKTSEYAHGRSWIDGTNGYIKIVYIG